MGAVCREKLLNTTKQVRVKGRNPRREKRLVDYWQDREERKRTPLVGSMARRELWRTEVDNGICEVICYGCKRLHKVKVKIYRSVPLKKLKKILYF